VLQTIALDLGGRADARLACRLATAVGRMTLIRLIRSLPDPRPAAALQVLGVDDFVLRRGHSYGTILIDITTSRPVEVLFDRSADGLAAWLHAHPGVGVVCRDRAGCYAEGTSCGAPEAIQVADRWHLWRNLGEREVTHLIVQADVPAQRSTAAAPVPELDTDGVRSGPLAERTRRRHAVIHHLLAHGRDLQVIARELGTPRSSRMRAMGQGS
jgi:transposase